jgi:hypothetical protein
VHGSSETITIALPRNDQGVLLGEVTARYDWSAGFRGGFIFPTFFAGTAIGHAMHFLITSIPNIEPLTGASPPILFCMTIAVGAILVQRGVKMSAGGMRPVL